MVDILRHPYYDCFTHGHKICPCCHYCTEYWVICETCDAHICQSCSISKMVKHDLEYDRFITCKDCESKIGIWDEEDIQELGEVEQMINKTFEDEDDEGWTQVSRPKKIKTKKKEPSQEQDDDLFSDTSD